MPPPYRLLIVEDHPMMREAYAEFFEATDDLEVARTAETAEEALALLAAPEPGYDVVLTDLSLPGMDGLAFVKQAHERWPALPCVVVTGHHEAHYEEMAAEVGAARFVQKGDPILVLAAVRDAARVADGRDS